MKKKPEEIMNEYTKEVKDNPWKHAKIFILNAAIVFIIFWGLSIVNDNIRFCEELTYDSMYTDERIEKMLGSQSKITDEGNFGYFKKKYRHEPMQPNVAIRCQYNISKVITGIRGQ